MGIIEKIEKWLQGKKTYLVIISGIIAAILAYLNGDMTLVQALSAIWVALGLGAVRSGVSKSGVK